MMKNVNESPYQVVKPISINKPSNEESDTENEPEPPEPFEYKEEE